MQVTEVRSLLVSNAVVVTTVGFLVDAGFICAVSQSAVSRPVSVPRALP